MPGFRLFAAGCGVPYLSYLWIFLAVRERGYDMFDTCIFIGIHIYPYFISISISTSIPFFSLLKAKNRSYIGLCGVCFFLGLHSAWEFTAPSPFCFAFAVADEQEVSVWRIEHPVWDSQGFRNPFLFPTIVWLQVIFVQRLGRLFFFSMQKGRVEFFSDGVMRVPHVPRAQALDDGDEEIAFFPGYDTPGGGRIQ